jgi:hypothetical protein
MKYSKNSSRLTVQFVDADTDDIIFEVPNRNWMNVGEFLTDYYVDEVVKTECKRKGIDPPENLMVIVAAEFTLN